MTETKTVVVVDAATSALNLAKAKALFISTLESVVDGKDEQISTVNGDEIRAGMNEKDNDAFDVFMDEEVVRMNDKVLDEANASTELRNAMAGYIEDSYLKLTNQGAIDDAKKAELIDKLSPSDTMVMMDYIGSEIAEAQVKSRLRANGYDIADVIAKANAMHEAGATGATIQ